MRKSFISTVIALVVLAAFAAALTGCAITEISPPTGSLEIYAGSGMPYINDGAAESAYFNAPKGVVAMSGGVAIADSGNGLIRIVSSSNGDVKTLAGTITSYNGYGKTTAGYIDGNAGAAFLGTPEYMCVSGGKLFFTDSQNNAVRVFDPDTNTVSTLYLGGDVSLSSPKGITADDSGNIYVADTGNHRILKIDKEGKTSALIGGSSGNTVAGAPLFEPCDVEYYDGALYVSDTAYSVVYKFENGNVKSIIGDASDPDPVSGRPTGGNSVGKTTLFSSPTGICVADGVLIVCDSGNNSVKAVFEDGSSVLLFGGDPGFEEGVGSAAKLNTPSDVAVIGGYIYITDTSNNAVRRAALNISALRKEEKTDSVIEKLETRSAVIYSIVKNDEGASPVVIRGGETTEAFEGMRLTAGDVVRTDGRSVVYFRIDDDKTVRLDQYSEMKLSAINTKKMQLSLTAGSFFFNVENKLGDDEQLQFTSGGTTMHVRGTSGKNGLNIPDIDPDKLNIINSSDESPTENNQNKPDLPSSETIIMEGSVDVTFKKSTENVSSLNKLSIGGGSSENEEVSSVSDIPDDIIFELSNNESYRNKFVASGATLGDGNGTVSGESLSDLLENIGTDEGDLMTKEVVTETPPETVIIVENGGEPVKCADGEHVVGTWTVVDGTNCEAVVYEGVCTKCGEKQTKTENIGHTYTETTVPAKCEEKGSITKTCSVCGHSEVTEIAPTGHSFDEGKVTKAATCTEEGVFTYTCTSCGATKTEPIAKTEHTPAVLGGTPATCDKDGKTDGTVCSVCGAVIKAQEKIPATGHDYDVLEIIEPTCTDGGYTTYVCLKCGDTYDGDETDPTGHTPGQWVTDKKPTCTEEGHKYLTCSECGEKIDEETIKANGHDFTDKIVDEKYLVEKPAEDSCTKYYLACHVCGAPSNDASLIFEVMPCGEHIKDVDDTENEKDHYTKSECGHYMCKVLEDGKDAHAALPCGHYVCQIGDEGTDGHAILPCGHYVCQIGDEGKDGHAKLSCGHYACEVGKDHIIYDCGEHCSYNEKETRYYKISVVCKKYSMGGIFFISSESDLSSWYLTTSCGKQYTLSDVITGVPSENEVTVTLPCGCCEMTYSIVKASAMHEAVGCGNGHYYCDGNHTNYTIVNGNKQFYCKKDPDNEGSIK